MRLDPERLEIAERVRRPAQRLLPSHLGRPAALADAGACGIASYGGGACLGLG